MRWCENEMIKQILVMDVDYEREMCIMQLFGKQQLLPKCLFFIVSHTHYTLESGAMSIYYELFMGN
jgi:hypothetical protein